MDFAKIYLLPRFASELILAVPPSTMSPRGADQSVDKSNTSCTDQYFHLEEARQRIIMLDVGLWKKNGVSKNKLTSGCNP